jgi:hypothetical protein
MYKTRCVDCRCYLLPENIVPYEGKPHCKACKKRHERDKLISTTLDKNIEESARIQKAISYELSKKGYVK